MQAYQIRGILDRKGGMRRRRLRWFTFFLIKTFERARWGINTEYFKIYPYIMKIKIYWFFQSPYETKKLIIMIILLALDQTNEDLVNRCLSPLSFSTAWSKIHFMCLILQGRRNSQVVEDLKREGKRDLKIGYFTYGWNFLFASQKAPPL